MESPLLTPTASDEKPRGRCKNIWSAVFATRDNGDDNDEPTNAETVQKLITVCLDLDLAMQHLDNKLHSKREQARSLYEQGRRPLALRVWATCKRYEEQHTRWFMMRENIEQLKSEIVAQQQTASVFKAFSKANQTLSRIAECMHPEKIESMLDSLHEKFRQGDEISNLLSAPDALGEGTGYDQETEQRELEAYVRGETVASESASDRRSPSDLRSPTDRRSLQNQISQEGRVLSSTTTIISNGNQQQQRHESAQLTPN